jgi:hypothetical protein
MKAILAVAGAGFYGWLSPNCPRTSADTYPSVLDGGAELRDLGLGLAGLGLVRRKP